MIKEDYKNEIINEYFKWLIDFVCGKRFAKEISYVKLLSYLHSTKFDYKLGYRSSKKNNRTVARRRLEDRDANRAEDGISLRWKFACDTDRKYIFDEISECLEGPCSMLEMMIALAIRCEETIMDNPRYGDRTGQWFWGMITNLGLGGMTDDIFDKLYVDDIVNRFLNREYEPDGKGGLFTIKNCEYDLRTIDIWGQLCWYLDSIS